MRCYRTDEPNTKISNNDPGYRHQLPDGKYTPAFRHEWLFDALKSGSFDSGISTEMIGDFCSANLAANVEELLPNLTNSVWVTPFYKWNLIHEDPDDNKYVDGAIACQADYIISHDKHFNVLSKIPFQGCLL
ncbi:PIN domain-containing protein [Dyadobacter bucti]|uniref:PIN domain-containing protein n=1 Tax=Dyadobacter bucti TaxID=2572203 RepID=UPI003F70D2D2